MVHFQSADRSHIHDNVWMAMVFSGLVCGKAAAKMWLLICRKIRKHLFNLSSKPFVLGKPSARVPVWALQTPRFESGMSGKRRGLEKFYGIKSSRFIQLKIQDIITHVFWMSQLDVNIVRLFGLHVSGSAASQYLCEDKNLHRISRSGTRTS